MDPKVKVNGTEYPLVTADEFTLGEAAEAEKITGQDYDMEKGGAAGLLAMTYISVRRVDPSVTVADIQALTGETIEVLTGGDAVPPPTLPASSDTGDGNKHSSEPGSSNGSDGSPGQTQEPTGVPV